MALQFDITEPLDKLQFIPSGIIANSKVGLIPPGRTYSYLIIHFDSTDSNGQYLSINGVDFLASSTLDANYKFYDNTFATIDQAESLVGAITTSPFLKYVRAEVVPDGLEWAVRVTAENTPYDLSVTRNDAAFTVDEFPNITRFLALNFPTQRRAGIALRLFTNSQNFKDWPAFTKSSFITEKKLLWTIEDNMEFEVSDTLRSLVTRQAPNNTIVSDAGPCTKVVWEAYNTSVDSTGSGSRENREFIDSGSFTVFQGFAPDFNYDWTTANNEAYWNYLAAPIKILGPTLRTNYISSAPDWTSILYWSDTITGEEIRVRVVDLDTLTEYFHSYGTVDTAGNLHLLTLRTDPTAILLPAGVENYQITIYAGGVLISEPKTYRFLTDRCDDTDVPTTICFLNRKGGWEAKYFYNYYEKGIEREFVTYNKFSFLNNRPTTTVGVGVNTAEVSYSTTLYSDFGDDLTELLQSPLVYKYQGGALLPIVITDTTFTDNRDVQKSYSITFVDSLTQKTLIV